MIYGRVARCTHNFDFNGLGMIYELLTIESWFSLLWVVESALDTHEWWGVAALNAHFPALRPEFSLDCVTTCVYRTRN